MHRCLLLSGKALMHKQELSSDSQDVFRFASEKAIKTCSRVQKNDASGDLWSSMRTTLLLPPLS